MDGGRRERGPADGRNGGERAHDPWLGDSGDASGVNLLSGVRLSEGSGGERGWGRKQHMHKKYTHTQK